jgi:NADH-quinone oxidoreductase subunit J
MACFLVASLGAVAGLFFLAGADFLGAVQLMVYVGGTMVLLVFGVMLTARGPFVSLRTSSGQWILAMLIGGALLTVLLQAATSIDNWAPPKSGHPAAVALEPTALPLGLELMSGYLLAFEIISVHLVVVLVGAAYLARAKRNVASGQRSGIRGQGSAVGQAVPDTHADNRQAQPDLRTAPDP